MMYKFSLYSPLHSWRAGQPPVNPFVSVAIGAHSNIEGQVLISSQLMTDAEIDAEVEALVEELEDFRKVAKSELRTIKEKMRGE